MVSFEYLYSRFSSTTVLDQIVQKCLKMVQFIYLFIYSVTPLYSVLIVSYSPETNTSTHGYTHLSLFKHVTHVLPQGSYSKILDSEVSIREMLVFLMHLRNQSSFLGNLIQLWGMLQQHHRKKSPDFKIINCLSA